MTPLACWREELRALIPRGFVRRDQEEGLFISDYPRWGREETVSAALLAAGFTVCLSHSLARIDGQCAKYRALLLNLPPAEISPPREENLYLHALALRLLRAQTPLERQPIPPLRLTLKYLDAGDLGGLSQKLPPLLALLQRRGEPLPSAAGTLILNALAEREKGEVPVC